MRVAVIARGRAVGNRDDVTIVLTVFLLAEDQ